MEDIAPKLLEKLKKTFRANLEADKRAENLRKKIEDGTANYEDVGNYAERAGDALAKAFDSCLTEGNLPDGRMYWNIAEKVIQPAFEDDYKILSEAAVKVQQQLNAAAKIGLKAQEAKIDTDMVIGVMNKVVAAEKYSDAAYVLRDASNVFSRSVVDNTLKENINFQGKTGRKPRIIRTPASGCCEWCAGLAGTYSYPNTPKDVYARHNNCNCIVEYDPGYGSSRQNVHTKQWTATEENAKIEARKTIGAQINREIKTVTPKQKAAGSLKMNMQFFASGADRATIYGGKWEEHNLDEAVAKFAPDATTSKTDSGKTVYSSSKSKYAVIFDHEGNYFRIEDTTKTGKRRYTDINGEDASNITENGKTRGRTRDEYESVTHFKNK